jgi:predicted outer membrane repeat protein
MANRFSIYQPSSLTRRAGAGRRRLGVEVLEDRLAPATLTVNSTADTANAADPYLSLREAVVIFNSPTLPTGLSRQILDQISGTLHAGGLDSIVFDHTQVSGPIMLAAGQLELRLPSSMASVTIDGGSGITVDGNNASRVFRVDSGVQASLENLTVAHGNSRAVFTGGGIDNGGTLTVSDCTLEANSAPSDRGGGIFNSGTLTVTDSTLHANSAFGSGGGIANVGLLTLSDATFSDNSADQGGGLFNAGPATVTDSTFDSNVGADGGGGISTNGTLTVTNSTLSSNSTTVDDSEGGGGIYVFAGTVTVTGTTLSGNFSNGDGGGIHNDFGTVTVNNSTLEANSTNNGNGAGIFNDDMLTVMNSTLSANSTSGGDGGGIENQFSVTVNNSTFSSNSADGDGGGIHNLASATLTASTFSDNSANHGGGLFNDDAGMLSVQNTIVAGNSSDSGPDLSGPVDSGSSYNLVGSDDGSLSGISDGVNHNQIGTTDNPIDPGLAALADYGGPTHTLALLANSPALDAGDPSLGGTPDQRGVVRSGGVNIGAFQASTSSLVVSAPSSVTPPGRPSPSRCPRSTSSGNRPSVTREQSRSVAEIRARSCLRTTPSRSVTPARPPSPA